MDKNYDHKKYEKEIYEKWEKSGAFKARGGGNPYTILMPPPNANASLHAGHAMYTIDDIMIRWKRMQGYSARWIPGMDHAGFETQFVYEKELAKKGQSRMDFDRQTLYENVFKFVKENSGLIYKQFKQLGFSADWERSVFTLDPQVLKQVFETFKRMESEGKAYKDEYIVNFCTHCGTSLAELEVEHEERTDPLFYVRYPLLHQGDKFMVVATTRVEPIWADTHLAVNPNDVKNRHLIGQKVKNPLTGAEMEIVGDEFVDPEFGTGIVKLTPAHDQADFEVARRQKLPIVKAVDLQGRMKPEAGTYSGLKVAEARKKVVEDLKEKGLMEKIDDKYQHSINLCYRCKRILEPMVMPNWFIKVDELKKPVIEAVKKDKVKFFPKRFKKHMLDWLEIMHDWPISRQIAWGIRIPVWYNCDDNPGLEISVLVGERKIRGKAAELMESGVSFDEIEKGLQTISAPKGTNYVVSEGRPTGNFLQETDTFDTWFSSGLWPIVTLKNGGVESKLPTDLMGTLADILKFWVSRMMMFSLYLRGEVPFRDVYLWSMVADAKGIKMSKSKGNVINPIDLVDKYGADALRMSLVYGVAPGSKIPLSEDKVRGMRNFSNKIWNIARFVESASHNERSHGEQVANPNDDDKLILDGLNKLIKSVTESLEKYRFNEAAEEIYEFIWHKFADVYIEKFKKQKSNIKTLNHVLITCLKLLHPFMPFVSEAVWEESGRLRFASRSQESGEMLITSSWPEV